MKRWWGAVVFAIGCNLVGVLGVLTTETGESTWYAELNKPPFQPPGWVFGPTWTLLYTLMGIAAWRIYRLGTDRKDVRTALILFGCQLVLNGIWSPMFFGAHKVGSALGILVALVGVLVATTIHFWRIDKLAGQLLLPYLGWASFATVLNFEILRLN